MRSRWSAQLGGTWLKVGGGTVERDRYDFQKGKKILKTKKLKKKNEKKREKGEKERGGGKR
jgi:hypothetical protein